MKPTLDNVPSNRDRDWHVVERTIGRPITDEDKLKLLCIWAGQSGHEKCGYCLKCNRPRFMLDKDCKHPLTSIYKGWV